MGHGHVDDLVDELTRGRLADEQPDLVKGLRDPGEEDEHTDAHGTDGVEVPDQALADNGHGQTEDIDDEVVAVVDEEDVGGGVAAVDVAVAEQAELGADGKSDAHQRHNLQVAVGALALAQRARRLDNQLHGHGRHQRAEQDDADRLDAAAANRVLDRVGLVGQARRDQHDNRRHQVHEGVGGRGEQRQRPGADGGVQLDAEQAEVDGEGGVDGELDLAAVLGLVLLVQPLLVGALQQLVDQLVLLLVERLDLARPRPLPQPARRPDLRTRHGFVLERRQPERVRPVVVRHPD